MRPDLSKVKPGVEKISNIHVETTRLSFSKHKSIWATFAFQNNMKIKKKKLYTYTHTYIYEKALLLEKINKTNQVQNYKKCPGTPPTLAVSFYKLYVYKIAPA